MGLTNILLHWQQKENEKGHRHSTKTDVFLRIKDSSCTIMGFKLNLRQWRWFKAKNIKFCQFFTCHCFEFLFETIFLHVLRKRNLNLKKSLPSTLWRSVALSSVLEPIRNLRQRQASFLRQNFLFIRSRISILLIAIFQRISTLLFEAIHGFFTIPDRLWKWILFSQAVLVDSTCKMIHKMKKIIFYWQKNFHLRIHWKLNLARLKLKTPSKEFENIYLMVDRESSQLPDSGL